MSNSGSHKSGDENGDDRILRVGYNCWRREAATKVAFLVDAADYFRTLHEALLRAREQVLILGWDVDGRLRLRRDGQSDGVPEQLRALLNFIVDEQPRLHVHVLLWDFAVLYALEREPLPSVNLGLRTRDRVHVSLDSSAPVGASRHEKIVVIDDRVAFCGGIDLTDNRWDTPEHAPDDPRRVNVRGDRYGPFHDVQTAVEGDAAAALGSHCRRRIALATGERLPEPSVHSEPWPEKLAANIVDTTVAIARTLPETDEKGINEIECLYVDAIAAAQNYIYIENQYFTSRSVAAAIAERLQADTCPEIVLVMPYRCSGWLEQQTMGVLRERLLSELADHDVHRRLGVFTPLLDGNGEDHLNVHAKLFVADDRFLRIGSANLTRRSFGMDSECDLAIEADVADDALIEAIRGLCNGLLAEHLGSTAAEVDESRTKTGSILATIDALGGETRRLEPLHPSGEDMPATATVAATLGDPSRPIEEQAMIEEFRDKIVEGVTRFSGVFGLIAIAAAAIALALAWRYTPLAEYVEIETVRARLEDVRENPAAPLIVLAIYLVTGLAAFPITVVNAAIAIAFGPWLGFCYALVGSLASAVFAFGVGNRFGRRVINRFSSGTAYRAVKAVGERGFLAVLSCRLVPVAPFTVINLVAGAMPIRIGDYLLGTVVGMAPGIAVLAAFGDRVIKIMDDPSLANLALLALIIVVWLGLGWGLSRLLRIRSQKKR